MIDLEAIEARDAAMPEGYVLVPELVDRRLLLRYVKTLRGLLQNVLDTREAEAKAEAKMRNAKRNYTNPRPYVNAWERAMAAASNAEKEARAALAEPTKEQP